MKNILFSFVLIISLCFCLSSYIQASAENFSRETSYDLLLVILEQGHIRIAHYPLWTDFRNSEILFSLDLSDNNENYSHLICSKNTNGVVIVRSNNDAMCDYCLNWGAMFGVNLVQSDLFSIVPVKIDKDENGNQNIFITGSVDSKEKEFDIKIAMDDTVKEIVALVVPAALVQDIKKNNEIMSFIEACRLGVISAKARNDIVQDPSIEKEMEFDRIIDSMLKDGTIQIKPVSPLMAQLRTIGSTLFVKYLALKNMIRTWYNAMWHQSAVQTANSINYNQTK